MRLSLPPGWSLASLSVVRFSDSDGRRTASFPDAREWSATLHGPAGAVRHVAGRALVLERLAKRVRGAVWRAAGGRKGGWGVRRGQAFGWPGARGGDWLVIECAGELWATGRRVRAWGLATHTVRNLIVGRHGLPVTDPARLVDDWRGRRWQVRVSRTAREQLRRLSTEPCAPCRRTGWQPGPPLLAHFEATPEAQAVLDANAARVRAENEAEERALARQARGDSEPAWGDGLDDE